MASRLDKDRAKQIEERCQNILMTMLKDEDNKYCVDCDAKGPRWASWNLGIFLCIRCAGIHRNLGVHISKVKSVNLDSWTPEQVVSLQQMGNSCARAVYEANLPDAFRRPQTDSSLEAFIRSKYETKKYIAREWVPPAAPKVNWDKEIDDEIEKQRKKKKSSLAPLSSLNADKKFSKSEGVPQLLPKPKSSVSPKPSRSTITVPSNDTNKPPKENADLLGLDNGTSEQHPRTNTQDDIFGSFFSGPQEKNQEKVNKLEELSNANTLPSNDLKTQEENFFKQAAPSTEEKSKLTKDSILALYSQAPSNQFSTPTSNATFQATFPPSQNQFTQPQSHFQQSQSQFQPSHSPFQAFNAPNQNGLGQSQAFQSGFNHFGSTGQLPQQQNNFANQFPNATFPAFGQNGGVHQQNGGFPQQNGGFSQQNGGFQQHNSQSMNIAQPALSQQFGNLNLGQFPNNQSVFPSNQSTNLTNTLWQ